MSIETRNQLYTYFETGDVPTAEEFKNLIDSQINQASDQVTAIPAGDGTSIIGISNSNRTARLNISGDNRTGNLLSLYQTSKATDFWLLSDTSRGEFRREESFVMSEATLETKFESSFESIPREKEGFFGIGGLNLSQNSFRTTVSRLFIQSDGKVGIGTTLPSRKLEVSETTFNDITGIKFYNTAARSYGWGMGHLHSPVPEKEGAYVIYEEEDPLRGLQGTERFTISRGGNVGINETLPDTKLHVSRSLQDINMPVDMREGTGIAIFGPMEENIVFDSSGIQARRGMYKEQFLSLSQNTLNLQPLGGSILVHGDESMNASTRFIITETGALGVGTPSPLEKVDVNGAIKIGTTDTTTPWAGTIRWNGADFEGFDGAAWQSFTAGGQVWLETPDENGIYYAPADAKVGIGTSTPAFALHVSQSAPITTGSSSTSSIAAFISNSSSTNNQSVTDIRVGLQIDCSAEWSSFDGPKNLGLYVSDVSGQALTNENYAAVLNGNVVIGDLTGSQLVGTGGVNVLAIQNGTAPATIPDSEDLSGGIQVYSANVSGVSIFHVMNGNSKVVKLYQGSALERTVTGTISSTYGDVEKNVLTSLRTKMDQLEAHLVALGLLASPPQG